MSKIQIMDEILANKIAAGEVVEKTMNVVKELVENAIDAQSDEIKIELIDSGVKEVKVTDNGIGMDQEDAKLAFSRHATSKLKNLDDLFNIESLGFRGEALPSIASVSNIELKTSNKEQGTYLTLSGGKDMHVEDSDLQKGTTITVKDLFYNTPVRLKYLKNLYVELANITDYVNKMALSYPDIKFTLINNGKILLDTDGKGDLRKVIYQIYGADVTKKMIEISGENDDYYIHGYISYPEMQKSNRNAITTLVNGRVIKNNELNKIITDAYHTYIPKDKFPIIVLNIDVDPILIDINIHPTKMDIKFSKMDTLKELVYNEITKQLEKLTLIPNISTRTEDAVRETTIPLYQAFHNNITEEPKYEETVLDFSIADTPPEEKKEQQEMKKEEIEAKEGQEEKKEAREARIKPMIPRGVVYLTYIIAENEDGMYIIDQHAAAERINYEKVLKSLKEKKQPVDLLIPIKIELTSNEFLIIKNHLDMLKECAFAIEEFGDNTIIVRSHPNWIPENIAEECIRKVIDIVVSKEKFDFDQFVWRMAATIACRMSIKANDYISYEDQVWLLDNLRYCDNPFTCPHGRPTIITYTRYELEKLFKRAQD